MTNAEMLVRLRSLLDETTADLYIDATELYPALSLAQIDVCKDVANYWDENGRKNMKPLPLTIRDGVTTLSSTIASGAFSFAVGDIIMPVAIKWNPAGAVASGKMCTYVSGEVRKLLENSLLADAYTFYDQDGYIWVNPVSTDNSAGYLLEYIDTPTDIDVSTQPVLQDVSHDAIVERACWILLKDRETQQAQLHLQMYGTLLQGLVK
jgi:hypothetical protein